MKLKKFQILFMLAFFCLPGILIAQTAEEIIAKHIDAHGGADNWEKVKALKITGRFTAFSLEKEFTTYKTKYGAYYSDLYLGEQLVNEGFNGECGWTIDPWQQIEYARNINQGETYVFQQKAEFFTPFYNYKEKGHQVKFLGKENVEGSEMFVLQLTRKNKRPEKWYLDTKSYLEFKCEADWVDFARTVPAEMYFDDFREVDGLVLPFFVERIFSIRDRITQIENIEINPKLDENMFTMPRRKEISKLAFMEGDWDVKLEFTDRQGEYREMGKTESCIKYASTNLLQEQVSYENYFPNSLSINYTYDQDTKKYRIAAFNDFTSTVDVFQGDLKENVLVLDDTKISYSNKQNLTKTCSQFIYTKIDNNNFTLENKVSNDQGVTWKPRARFTYVRKQDDNVSQK